MNIIYCGLLLLCPYIIHAQPPKALGIGGTLPLSMLPAGFVNAKAQPPTSDLYVLNFMATTCASCIGALPKANELQQQFNGRLQLMLISKEPKEKVQKFLNKRPWLRIPFAAQQHALYPYFPHEYISHLVWLNAKGTVLAITGTEYLTQKNISYLLAGNIPAWPVKNDIALTQEQPSLYQSANTPLLLHDPSQQQYGGLYAYDSTRPSAVHFITDSIEGTSRLSSLNQPLLHIITKGLGFSNWPAAFIRLQGIDTSLLHFNPNLYYRSQWNKECSFSFETSAPTSATKEQHQQMQLQLLQQYFGINAQIKDSLICTWSLTELNPDATAPSLPSAAAKQLSLSTLLYNYNKEFSGTPLIDNRQHKQKLLINIPATLPANPMLLNNTLMQYNLSITPAYNTVAILFINQNTAQPVYSPSKTFLK